MTNKITRFLLPLMTTALLASCNAAGFRAPRAELGTTYFEEDDGTVGAQPELGIGFLFQDDVSAGNFATGWVGDAAIRHAEIDADLGGADLTGDRQSVDLGARFYPYTGSMVYQFFVGFGGTIQRLHLEDGTAGSVTEVTPGAYGVIGAEFAVGRRLRVGIQYRHTAGIETDLGDNPEEQDLDGGSLMLTLGLGL